MVVIAMWGLVVAFSMAGWGALVERVLLRSRGAGFGLRAAWGMALYLAAGGLLVLCHLASRPFLLTLVGVGVVLGALAARDVPATPRPRWFLVAIGACVALPFLSSIYEQSDWYAYDDAPAYFVFIKQILHTGTFDQPFSIRALVSFGGQSLLQSIVVAPSDAYLAHVHLLDKGICSLLIVSILIEQPKQRGRNLAIAAALVFFLSVQNPRENSASALTGTVLFLALEAALLQALEHGNVGPNRGVLLALVSAALCALRPNYIPIVAFAVLMVMGSLVWDARGNRDAMRERAVDVVRGSALTVAFLVPWMIQSYRVFHTPLFPMFRGTFHDEASGMRAGYPADIDGVKMVFAVAHQIWGYCAAPLFLGIGLIARGDGRSGRTVPIFAAAAILGILAQIKALPSMPDEAHLRYCIPYLLATVLIVIIRVEQGPPWPLVAAALVAHLTLHEERTLKDLTWEADTIALRRLSSVTAPEIDARYAALQAQLDAGAEVYVATDEPYRFDFRRNPIFVADFPANVGPGPFTAWSGDAERLREYLIAHGVRYLVAQEFGTFGEFYSRPKWEQNRNHKWEIQRALTPIFIQFMDQVEKLEATCKRAASEPRLVGIDLSQCSP